MGNARGRRNPRESPALQANPPLETQPNPARHSPCYLGSHTTITAGVPKTMTLIVDPSAKESQPDVVLAGCRLVPLHGQPMSGVGSRPRARVPGFSPAPRSGFDGKANQGLICNRKPSFPWGRAARIREVGFSSIDVVALLVMVAAFLVFVLPALVSPSRTKAPRINCVSNLKQVGLALRIYANDHDEKLPWMTPVLAGGSMEFLTSGKVYPHFLAASNELVIPKILRCPAR